MWAYVLSLRAASLPTEVPQAMVETETAPSDPSYEVVPRGGGTLESPSDDLAKGGGRWTGLGDGGEGASVGN